MIYFPERRQSNEHLLFTRLICALLTIILFIAAIAEARYARIGSGDVATAQTQSTESH